MQVCTHSAVQHGVLAWQLFNDCLYGQKVIFNRCLCLFRLDRGEGVIDSTVTTLFDRLQKLRSLSGREHNIDCNIAVLNGREELKEAPCPRHVVVAFPSVQHRCDSTNTLDALAKGTPELCGAQLCNYPVLIEAKTANPNASALRITCVLVTPPCESRSDCLDLVTPRVRQQGRCRANIVYMAKTAHIRAAALTIDWTNDTGRSRLHVRSHCVENLCVRWIDRQTIVASIRWCTGFDDCGIKLVNEVIDRHSKEFAAFWCREVRRIMHSLQTIPFRRAPLAISSARAVTTKLCCQLSQLGKGGTLMRISIPAHSHQTFIHSSGTAVRL
mmetsp:Transcript_15178/g.39022  ORF Transcript_15178/g.39022 Transcript_15178/m.39022 type:complete len:328 (-) Transcript_15178:3315-4298(-)